MVLTFQVNRDDPAGRNKIRHLLSDGSQDLIVSLVLQYREEEGVHYEIFLIRIREVVGEDSDHNINDLIVEVLLV